jgi:hypothetical protein
MDCSSIRFSRHAITRAFERAIPHEHVVEVLRNGEPIEDYPDDTPYPSQLLLGIVGDRPLHVVAARDPANGDCIVVTCYRPDPAVWRPDFKRRKTPG